MPAIVHSIARGVLTEIDDVLTESASICAGCDADPTLEWPVQCALLAVAYFVCDLGERDPLRDEPAGARHSNLYLVRVRRYAEFV